MGLYGNLITVILIGMKRSETRHRTAAPATRPGAGQGERRGKPRSPVAALLEAAFAVFAARGYRATRLEEVAEAAGVTKGAIYHYFDSKEELLRRAFEHRHHVMFTEIASAIEGERSPASVKVRHVLRKVWQHWTEPEWGQAFRLLVGEISVEFPALFRIWAQDGPIRGWELIRELIEEGVKRGEFRVDADPEVSARLIVSGLMLQAAFQVHLGLGELAPCDADRIFDSSVEQFLHGLSVVHGLASRE
jgi:AcrR family transcriptional regulator